MRGFKRFFQTNKLSWLLLGVSGLLTWIAYGAVLRFPFMFDDLIHLRWLQGRSALGVWGDIKGMQHYRPLVLSIWALSMELFGPHNAWPLHLMTLLLHVGNACLVGWLAYQVSSQKAVAIAACALFATFPFSYQVMPSPGSQSKPLSTLLILVACWLYWKARRDGKRVLLGAAILVALLAPFAYEAAVTVGGFMLLIEFLLWRKGLIKRMSPYALLLALLGAPFLVAWALVPSSYGVLSFPGFEALWQSSIYFLQGLTWPAALLAKPLMRFTGLSDGIATAWVAYGATIALVLVSVWRRRTDTVIVAFAWYGLALVVQWVTLSFRYVIDGPRILYTASVGMALLWADLIISLIKGAGRARWLWRAVGAIVLVAMVVWGMRFAMQRVDLCEAGLAPLEAAREVAVEANPDETLLFINMPRWMAPSESGFALGHEGYTLMPPYYGIGLRDYVYVNAGIERDILMGSLVSIRQEWKAPIGYHEHSDSYEALAESIHQADQVYVLDYREDSLGIVRVGGTREGERAERLALYGGAIELRDVRCRKTDTGLRVDLLWSARELMPEPYTVFLHLYGPDGWLVAQDDGLPLGGTYPFRLWHIGEAVQDVRTLDLPSDWRADGHVIGVGLYHSETGERAAAQDASGKALRDQTYRLSLASN